MRWFTHISSSIVLANEDIIVSSKSAIVLALSLHSLTWFSARRNSSETHETRACTSLLFKTRVRDATVLRAAGQLIPLAASSRDICRCATRAGLPIASNQNHRGPVILMREHFRIIFCFAAKRNLPLSTYKLVAKNIIKLYVILLKNFLFDTLISQNTHLLWETESAASLPFFDENNFYLEHFFYILQRKIISKSFKLFKFVRRTSLLDYRICNRYDFDLMMLILSLILFPLSRICKNEFRIYGIENSTK